MSAPDPEQTRKIVEAARRMDRLNLDAVAVHVCDRADDRVRRQGLYGEALDLSVAIAEAGLTLPFED